ncbi:S-adenosyl-L-methionine-dependent methyltransferase [Nemania sp. FL0031]|nr:S-adenosyl-L-methionine-dependent methyltransferase [Nemania sp. FL0031]
MASEPPTIPPDFKERMKASYDAMASTYNAWTIPHSQQRMEYLGKALERLDITPASTSNLSFLELGCGCGLPVTQKLLSFPGAKVVANDLSDTQISLARENLIPESKDNDNNADKDDTAQRLQLIQGDMTKLSFPDATFDLVAGFYSIIHLPRDEQTALLERIARWLKPGGYLVANFSKEEATAAVNEKWLDDKGWMFWSGWGEKKTLEMLKAAGFEVVVAEVLDDVVDASFLWVVAKR